MISIQCRACSPLKDRLDVLQDALDGVHETNDAQWRYRMHRWNLIDLHPTSDTQLRLITIKLDGAALGVSGVRQADHTSPSVNLHPRCLCCPRIDPSCIRGWRISSLQTRGSTKGKCHFCDLDLHAHIGTATDDHLRLIDAGHRGHTSCRPEQIGKRVQALDTHIPQWAATLLIEPMSGRSASCQCKQGPNECTLTLSTSPSQWCHYPTAYGWRY